MTTKNVSKTLSNVPFRAKLSLVESLWFIGSRNFIEYFTKHNYYDRCFTVDVLHGTLQRETALGKVKQARQTLINTIAMGTEIEPSSTETKGRRVYK